MSNVKGRFKFVILIFLASALVAFLIYYSGGSSHIKEGTKYKLYSIGQSLMLYHEDYGQFPSSEEGLDKLYSDENKYLRYPDYTDLWGNRLVYMLTPDSVQPFELYSVGENEINDRGRRDDIDYWEVREELGEKLK